MFKLHARGAKTRIQRRIVCYMPGLSDTSDLDLYIEFFNIQLYGLLCYKDSRVNFTAMLL
ncbi:hypothetical protein BGX38DRAFT_1186764 [Terfezia claveryi]|nr:hypothetical protein BGX38DRAFT_1186764 [Terfezia claveryi]